MEEIKVKNVVISKQAENSYNFQEFIKIAQRKKINIIVVGADELHHSNNFKIYMNGQRSINTGTSKLEIEKNLYIDVLWPNNSKLISENALNNNSIVCKLIYRNFSILFTGDIEAIAERKILEEYKENLEILSSTILKVGHHGSKTSSTQEFLNIVKPKIALIGVGKDNKFGHPNEEVINRLEKIRSKSISNRSSRGDRFIF